MNIKLSFLAVIAFGIVACGSESANLSSGNGSRATDSDYETLPSLTVDDDYETLPALTVAGPAYVATADESALVYTTFEGRPVFLKGSRGSRDNESVSLCVQYPSSQGYSRDHALVFLRDEVVRLTSTRSQTLGMSGYTFSYAGGYPIWAPGNLLSRAADASCIYFGGGSIDPETNTVSTFGDPSPNRYNGYEEWKPVGQ